MRGVSEKTPEAAPPSEEERKLAGPPEPPARVPPRVVVARWVQLVLLPIALLALWALAKAAGKVLVIFIVAAVIALILNPAVAFVQRRRIPRGLAVLAVYLAFFLMLSGVGVLLANPISDQVASFSHNVPHLVRQANTTLARLQNTLNENGLHIHLIEQGETATQTLGEKLVKGSSSIVSFGGGLLTEAATASFDVLLVFVLSVYMLLYGERIGRLIRRYMPDGDGTPADDYPTLVQSALARYVGGQLLFSLIMGATSGIALYLLGVVGVFPDGRKYAVVFAVFYGLMELVPYIGPIVGALPAVLVALISDPISALWVAVVFVALQQLEGHVVAPQIFGHTLRINPLLVIFALLLGLQVHGIVGALIARDLAKDYGGLQALQKVSLDADAGEVVALLGPNGAGKTTLLSILAGAQSASSGTVNLGAREVGWVPQQSALYLKLSVAENLELFARLAKVADPVAAVEGMLEQTGLQERARELVGRLSGGNRQRVNVAIGLIGDPPVLALDEPTASLDPAQRERIWQFLTGLARGGTTVLFSTHNLGEVQRHATRALVLAHGRLLFDASPTALLAHDEPRQADLERALLALLARERTTMTAAHE